LHKKFTVQRPLFFNDAAAGVTTLNASGREVENAPRLAGCAHAG
jgi:hypothetical protein